MSEPEKKNFIQKVIMWNVIVILALLLLGMITIFTTGIMIGGKVLIDQISFASSLTSIILAIMAMIYAFFQARESSQQNVQVQSSLNKIDDKVFELFTMKEDVSSLKKDIELQSEGVSSSISDMKEVIEEIKETAGELKTPNATEYNQKISAVEKKIDQLEKKNIFVTAKGKSHRGTNTNSNTNTYNQEAVMKFYEAILKYNKINEAVKKLDTDQLAKLAQLYNNHLNKDEKKD